MRRQIVMCAICCLALMVCPASAASAPAFDIEFPPGWTVEQVEEAIGDSPAHTILRAYPEGRAEECRLADLGPVGSALAEAGVTTTDALNYAAADLLGHGGSLMRVSGLGYSDPWSMYMEGSTGGDAGTFAFYNYLGRDAWTGLEDAWLVLECRSEARFHQDWELIARTFSYALPEAVLESTGPLVFGGRIELPMTDLALLVPDAWVAADLGDPGLAAALDGGGKAGEWLTLQLEQSIGDALDKRAESGEDLVLWAWDAASGAGWPEHCELVVQEDTEWDSAAEMAELGAAYIADNEDLHETHEWTLVKLPAGEVARYDYRWTPTTGGTDFYLVEPERQVTLSCQDYAFGDDADVAAKRHRWQAIAETLQPLP